MFMDFPSDPFGKVSELIVFGFVFPEEDTGRGEEDGEKEGEGEEDGEEEGEEEGEDIKNVLI